MIYKFDTFRAYLDALVADKALLRFYQPVPDEARRLGLTRAGITNQVLRGQRSAVRIGRRLTLVSPAEWDARGDSQSRSVSLS